MGKPCWETAYSARLYKLGRAVSQRARKAQEHNRTPRTSVYRGLLLFLCLFALSACGLPGNAAPVIKIGLIAPFEGLGRPLGYELLPAVRLAVADANASGQLKPYRVALVALNDDERPATAAKQAQILVGQPEVMGIVGPWSGATVDGVIPVLAQAGMPSLAGAQAISLPAGVRSLCPSPDVLASRLLARAAGSGAQMAGLSGPENSLARALQNASSPGLPIRSAGDIAESITLHSGNAEEAGDDLRAWRAAGWRGKLLGGPDIARSWFASRAGEYADGVQALVCSAPESLVPASFRSSYLAQNGTEPSPEAALAYAGARLMLQALAADIGAQGQPTRQGISVALAQVPLETQTEWLVVDKGRWVAARFSESHDGSGEVPKPARR